MATTEERISWPGWETVGMIGRGSFGAVYEIRRQVFEDTEKAALKVISVPQNKSDIEDMYNDGYDAESLTLTFQSHLKNIVGEYSLMRKLNGCANIVNCEDVRYVQHDDGIGWDIFIKMELLTPLYKALPAQIQEQTVVKLARDMCAALELCSKHGIIHRDIKPQNIFISEHGDYKLGDFGIAKTVEKTMGGTRIGTYKYMAPEVFHNQPYGCGADIYSLGLVLYWMLNERRMPFMPLPPQKLSVGMDEESRNRRLAGEPLPAPAHGSAKLKRIVQKACAFDPAQRYHTAAEMLQDLEAAFGPTRVAEPAAVAPVPPPKPTEPPKAAEEAHSKAEEERRLKEVEEARRKAAEERKRQKIEEDRRKAEEERKRKETEKEVEEEQQQEQKKKRKIGFAITAAVIVVLLMIFLPKACQNRQWRDDALTNQPDNVPQQNVNEECAHEWIYFPDWSSYMCGICGAEVYVGESSNDAGNADSVTLTAVDLYSSPVVADYYVGDSLDTKGLTLYLTYSDGSTEFVNSGFTCSPTTLDAAGKQVVTVFYGGHTVDFTVNVHQKNAEAPPETTYDTPPETTYDTPPETTQPIEVVLEGVNVYTQPDKYNYYLAETLNADGLILQLMYSDGSTKLVDNGFSCSPMQLDWVGAQNIEVDYQGYTDTFTVFVEMPQVMLSQYYVDVTKDCWDSYWNSQRGVPLWKIDYPTVTTSPYGGAVSWSIVSGSAYIASDYIAVQQPGTIIARAEFTYAGVTCSADYTIWLSLYKTPTANNSLKERPSKNANTLTTVPAYETVYITEVAWDASVRDSQGQYYLWGKTTYNGKTGWIVIS